MEEVNKGAKRSHSSEVVKAKSLLRGGPAMRGLLGWWDEASQEITGCLSRMVGKKNLIFFLFWIILLAGASLRLYRISDYMTFLGDEGRDVLVVKRMIVDKKFTLLGPITSVGSFYMGPIYYYFMVPFLWFWRLDPTGPAVMVALFGIATIFLVFKVGKEFFNEKVGLIACLLYAVSPLVITYSRSSWNPNLVPFFSLLYIYALGKTVKAKSLFWFFLAGLVMGIGLQLHYLFSFLIPVGATFVLIFKRGFKNLKSYGVIILGVLVGWAPFLAFELRHRFPNTKTIINFISTSKTTGFTSPRALAILGDVIFRLFGRLVFSIPSSEKVSLYSSKTIFWWYILTRIVIFLSVLALIYQIVKTRKPAQVLVLLWFIFGVGLFAFYGGAIYDYYLGFLFPLPFLLIGNLLDLGWQKRLFKPVVLIAFIGLLIVNWSGRPFKFKPNRQLEQTKEIARFVMEKTGGKPYNFALITAQNSDHAYRYFLEIWNHPPTVIENPEVDPERKSVTNQLLIVCEDTSCKPLGHSLWEVAGFGRAEIVGEWDVSVVKVYKLIHYEVGPRTKDTSDLPAGEAGVAQAKSLLVPPAKPLATHGRGGPPADGSSDLPDGRQVVGRSGGIPDDKNH